MPCLEITLPEIDRGTKEQLVCRLTEAFTNATSFPAAIFGMRFHEYTPGEAGTGGKLCDGGEERPYIHFLFYGPRLNRKTKQQLVRALGRAYTDVIGKPDWQPVIHLCEFPYDNVGVNGELLSDTYDECASAKFYFDLSDK
ncbi:MAG: tautomerase family protein [Candidatus Zixiibacteriota bacterium]